MPTPLPWSPSALDDFVNCPKAYHAKRVIKIVKDVQGEEAIWGVRVHKAFELRQQKQHTPLPPELIAHEPYMQKLEKWNGQSLTESKIALDRKLQLCGYFSPEVWYRGVLDFRNIDGSLGRVIDYKTGKPHEKQRQLKLYAINIFTLHPEVNIVDARYYWTSTYSETRHVWERAELPMLWDEFIPDLKQYHQAFKTDTWQARPSGLCHGWCAHTACEHWKPKRIKR